jgi:hypothetical protein
MQNGFVRIYGDAGNGFSARYAARDDRCFRQSAGERPALRFAEARLLLLSGRTSRSSSRGGFRADTVILPKGGGGFQAGFHARRASIIRFCGCCLMELEQRAGVNLPQVWHGCVFTRYRGGRGGAGQGGGLRAFGGTRMKRFAVLGTRLGWHLRGSSSRVRAQGSQSDFVTIDGWSVRWAAGSKLPAHLEFRRGDDTRDYGGIARAGDLPHGRAVCAGNAQACFVLTHRRQSRKRSISSLSRGCCEGAGCPSADDLL